MEDGLCGWTGIQVRRFTGEKLKYDLTFDRPLMNAAGFLGFVPNRRLTIDVEELGAFVTNPVSLQRRTAARGERFLEFDGGFLLHTGHPDPGLKAVIKRFASRWARQTLPVWVHLLAQSVEELGQMVSLLEGREGIAGLEVGLASDVDSTSAQAYTRAAYGELPVLVRLPLERSIELAAVVMEAGAAAVSLGPPRGALPIAGADILYGRLYGPAIYPQALETVKRLSSSGITVVGSGGVYREREVEAMLDAGAIAVQLDAVLWRGWMT